MATRRSADELAGLTYGTSKGIRMWQAAIATMCAACCTSCVLRLLPAAQLCRYLLRGFQPGLRHLLQP